MCRRRMQKETCLYEVLQVKRTASSVELKKAYHKLARTYHPDRNRGNEVEATEKFKEVQYAYNVLSDDNKRKVYDRHGHEGLKEGGARAGASRGGMGGIFKHFFGEDDEDESGGEQRGEDIAFRLSVDLKDLYCGSVKELPINKNVICETCEGEGTTVKGARVVCKRCNGQGKRIELRQMGPFVSQAEVMCSACAGRGESIRDSDRCRTCFGKKVLPHKQTLKAHIEKGMQSGERITFYGEASQYPGQITADIIIVVEQKKDDDCAFTREGNDLHVERTISLAEALCGFTFDMQHMDGRTLVVRGQPGDVVKPGDRKVVVGEGMPLRRDPQDHGNLIITFNIAFPEPHHITADAHAALLNALPKPDEWALPEDVDTDTVSEHTVIDYIPSTRDRHGGGEAYDSDDEHPRHQRGGAAQCQFQ